MENLWKNRFIHHLKRRYIGKNMALLIGLPCKINSEIVLTEVRKKLMTEYIPDEIYGMVRIYVYGSVTLLRSYVIKIAAADLAAAHPIYPLTGFFYYS